MIFSYFRVLTCGYFILILLSAIQSELLTNVLDTVGNDVGDLVDGVTDVVDNVEGGVGDLVNSITGDSKTTKFCRMNTVNSICDRNGNK